MKSLCWIFLSGIFLLADAARADALDQWMTRTSPVPFLGNDVIYARNLFVAVGMIDTNGFPRLIVSSNGVDWTRFPSFAQFTPYSITYGSNGLFVAVGRTGDGDSTEYPGVIVSTNGTNWSFFPTFGTRFAARTNFAAVTYGNGMFVAVGQGVAATSYDGTNWATHPVPANALNTVAYGNGLWVASAISIYAEGGGPSYGSLIISTNGTNWMEQELYFNAQHILFANGRFVASRGPFASGPFTNHRSLRVSSDGTNWMEITNSFNINPRRVTYGGGIYVAVGPDIGGTNFAAVSFDATNWTARPLYDTNRLRSVAYGANTFVAMGDIILQSEDIRPRLRVGIVPNPFGSPSPDHRLYLRGISNAAYAIEVSQNLTNWQERVSPQTATGGDDLFYTYSGSSGQGFRRARQVP